MAIDLQVEAAKLQALVGRKRTNAARVDVEAGLRSKWEGLQSVALRVLGSWGDSESKAALRSFLESAGSRQFGWSIRSVAIQELARCVGEVDCRLGTRPIFCAFWSDGEARISTGCFSTAA